MKKHLTRKNWLFGIICSGFMLLSVSLHAQNRVISINENNKNLKEVMKEIEKKSGYNFMYVDNLVDLDKNISISQTDTDIDIILKNIFSGLDINYSIVDKQIVLSKKEGVSKQKVKSANNNQAKPKMVRGIVKDADGIPLPAATVYTKDKKTTVLTDLKGYYEIKVENPAEPLFVSFVGMETKEFMPSETIQETIMKSNSTSLTGVVITGYQTLKRVHNTGSVTTIKKENIEKRSMGSLNTFLKGTVAGLYVGKDGFKIRGGGSINAGNEPLFVVDGVESTRMPDNLDMIENITVLKDAAAAAVWGSRAGNGVIVITTKRGNKGDLNISYNNSFDIGMKPDLSKLHKLSSRDLIDFEKEGYAKKYYFDQSNENNGYTLSNAIFQQRIRKEIDDAEMNRRLDSLGGLSNSQQLKDYFLRVPFTQKHFLSFSGGTDKLLYYLSGSYTNGHGDLIGGDNESYGLNSRLSYIINPSLTLRTDIRINFSNSKQAVDLPMGVMPYRFFTRPDGSYIYDFTKVNINKAEDLYKKGYYHYGKNELEDARLMDDKSKGLGVMTHIGLDYNIYKGLKWVNDFQYDKQTYERKNISSEKSYDVRNELNYMISVNSEGNLVFNLPKGDILAKQNSTRNAWIAKTALTWDSYIDSDEKHYLNAIGGFEVRKNTTEFSSIRKFGYDDKLLVWQTVDEKTLGKEGIINWQGYKVNYSPSDEFTYRETREVSSFASVVYTYDKRYNASASFRMDESSMFGVSKKNRKNPIWSIGAGWNISNESFFHSKDISNLSLRATYGITGNFDRSGRSSPFLLAQRWYSAAVGGNVVAIDSDNPPNPLLKWEKVRSLNIATSAEIWNRISIDLEYYNNYSYDLLGTSVIDPTLGFASAYINAADMSNRGIEVSVLADVIRKKDFTWSTAFVFSYNKNKVQNNKVADSDPAKNRVTGDIQFIEGYAREALWSYKWAGLDDKGSPQIYDSQNNKVKTLALESLYCAGTTLPVYTGSLSTGLTYKDFMLNILFSYNLGHKFRLPYPFVSPWMPEDNDLIAQRWRKPGDELKTDIPAIQTMDNVELTDSPYLAKYSSNSIRNAGFVRLSEVSFIYTLPKSVLKDLHVKRLSVSLQGNNLLLWTVNKEGVDPEVFSTPEQRKYSFPTSPSFSFGLKLDI